MPADCRIVCSLFYNYNYDLACLSLYTDESCCRLAYITAAKKSWHNYDRKPQGDFSHWVYVQINNYTYLYQPPGGYS